MPITSLRRSDRGLAGSGSTRTSVPSGKFASGGRTTVPFETTPTKLITTSRLSTRVHYTLLGNPSFVARVSPPASRGRDPLPGRQGTTPREAQNPEAWSKEIGDIVSGISPRVEFCE